MDYEAEKRENSQHDGAEDSREQPRYGSAYYTSCDEPCDYASDEGAQQVPPSRVDYS